MAVFETIVRPVVFPNIRPAPAQVLAPEDDPTQGMAVISAAAGGGGLSGSRSWSVNLSRQKPHKEAVRQFNKERVYQVEQKPGGASIMHQDNYVEVERLKRVRLDTTQGPIKVLYSDPPKVDNVTIIQADVTRSS
jgi:hypothetical protein